MADDAVVVGAGAVGVSTALHLARQGVRVTVLEKEAEPALHQSGRNSGVIHAGYNLKPGSAKARFCIEGARRLRRYCEERGVPVQGGGILVVARQEGERAVLDELHRRATGNGVRVRMLDPEGIVAAEPAARGIAALQAEEGASLDARAYVRALAEDAGREGVRFRYGVRVAAIASGGEGVAVRSTAGTLRARHAVNAAGLFADRLAGRLAPDMRIIPFRGYYAELRPERAALVRSHVYAAPDLAFPFLGVHLSRRTDGRVIVGPGAMLAFGREAYRMWQVNLRDLAGIVGYGGFWRMLAQKRVRALVRSEVGKSLRLRAVWKEARRLVPELRPGDLVRSYAGNRAQMVDRRGDLVEDVVVRRDGGAVHVLNAVSPGLTCSLPFGEHLARVALGATPP